MTTDLREIATGLDHPEGVAWGRDGRLWAGGEAGQIYKVSTEGEVLQVGGTGGFIYGIALDGGGRVYACDFGNACVMRLDGVDAATPHVYSSGTPERPMRVPNFACFDDEGNLYVTDSGDWSADDGCVFKVEPGGRTTVWTSEVPAFPNGCCLTAAGDALLVVESRGRRVVRIPIGDDGQAGSPVTAADLAGSQPDGIALGIDGTMFVGCYRPDRIWRIEPGGEPHVWMEDPDGISLNQPANVAFFGDRLERLAISSLGGWSLMEADPGVEGLRLRYPTLS